jgi:hypothetical protein
MNKGTIPIEYAPDDACMVENPLTTHSPGMSMLDRRYDGPYKVSRKEGISRYKIDFENLLTGNINFPGRYQVQVLNQDKLIPYVNCNTGEQRVDTETLQEGEEMRANDGDEPDPLPPPDNWGADPAPRDKSQQAAGRVFDTQKSITDANEVTRVTGYRGTQVSTDLRDDQHGDVTTR